MNHGPYDLRTCLTCLAKKDVWHPMPSGKLWLETNGESGGPTEHPNGPTAYASIQGVVLGHYDILHEIIIKDFSINDKPSLHISW